MYKIILQTFYIQRYYSICYKSLYTSVNIILYLLSFVLIVKVLYLFKVIEAKIYALYDSHGKKLTAVCTRKKRLTAQLYYMNS